MNGSGDFERQREITRRVASQSGKCVWLDPITKMSTASAPKALWRKKCFNSQVRRWLELPREVVHAMKLQIQGISHLISSHAQGQGNFVFRRLWPFESERARKHAYQSHPPSTAPLVFLSGPHVQGLNRFPDLIPSTPCPGRRCPGSPGSQFHCSYDLIWGQYHTCGAVPANLASCADPTTRRGKPPVGWTPGYPRFGPLSYLGGWPG